MNFTNPHFFTVLSMHRNYVLLITNIQSKHPLTWYTQTGQLLQPNLT